MCIHFNQAVLVVFRDNIWGKGITPHSSALKINLFSENWRDTIYAHYILLSISRDYNLWLNHLDKHTTLI